MAAARASSPNSLYEMLRTGGPTRMSELPREPDPGDRRQYGIRRVLFRVPSGAKAEPVYYLPSHDPESVVRAFLDVNPSVLDQSERVISHHFRTHSTELQEAWQDIADEYDIEGSGGGHVEGSNKYDGECPLCGDDDFVYLSHHLPNCDGK